MKCDFVAKTGAKWFSLSNTDMTTANEFLTFLIDFCLEFDIPTTDNLLDRSPEIARYILKCLIEKKCVVCGERAELHHVDAVGMGRNRREINHVGMKALPLCRKHHSEAHSIGQAEFNHRYHVFGIRLDNDLCNIWRLRFGHAQRATEAAAVGQNF
jgi:hypothetical protein